MRKIDTHTWNRKQHYEHFSTFKDPYFGVTIPFDVTKAYNTSKKAGVSFFCRYLHDCMKAINAVENFKYRIEDNNVIAHDVIHASPTIARTDNTYGFSFIEFDEDLPVFIQNFEKEKRRIQNSDALYPHNNGSDCIHCSALPWFNFTGQQEPSSGKPDSVPKLAFGKSEQIASGLRMNVSINVNHALIDGYHVGLFAEKFQFYLNN